jgi:hypothetical protein
VKYIIIQAGDLSHLLIFPDNLDHAGAWGRAQHLLPEAKLLSAGKIYLEACDCYPGEHYLTLRPGSTTLNLTLKTQAEYATHYELALGLMGAELPFQADGRQIYGSRTLPSWTERRPGSQGKLALVYAPREVGRAQRVKVATQGLDEEQLFYFWQAFKQI